MKSKDGKSQSLPEIAPLSSSLQQFDEFERKARIDAVWEQMSRGVSTETLKLLTRKRSSTLKKAAAKPSNNWMNFLGLAQKKSVPVKDVPQTRPNILQNANSDEAKRLAAAALSAVKEAAAAAVGRGKAEISEIRDFAGEEIEVKKLVDANSKEAVEKAKAPSAVDSVLEQIKKKPKLSVLDKTKKDWGEFKEENKGLEDELDAYKKSSNQYLDKVSFLQRTDYREFERERDVRLASQSKRRPDLQEEP